MSDEYFDVLSASSILRHIVNNKRDTLDPVEAEAIEIVLGALAAAGTEPTCARCGKKAAMLYGVDQCWECYKGATGAAASDDAALADDMWHAFALQFNERRYLDKTIPPEPVDSMLSNWGVPVELAKRIAAALRRRTSAPTPLRTFWPFATMSDEQIEAIGHLPFFQMRAAILAIVDGTEPTCVCKFGMAYDEKGAPHGAAYWRAAALTAEERARASAPTQEQIEAWGRTLPPLEFRERVLALFAAPQASETQR